MLLQAIGSALPAALAVALSPFPIIGVVLILAGPCGRRNGPLFAAGWVAGLGAVAGLVVLLTGGADDPDGTASLVVSWLQVLGGAALIGLGVRKWWTRPRPGEAAAAPSWMASLDGADPARAVALGALLSGANPKNLVLTAAATASIIETGAHGADLVAAIVVFVLVGSLTVVGAVILRLFGGARGADLLESVRGFMVANSVAITVVVLMILGAKVLGDGLAGLGR